MENNAYMPDLKKRGSGALLPELTLISFSKRTSAADFSLLISPAIGVSRVYTLSDRYWMHPMWEGPQPTLQGQDHLEYPQAHEGTLLPIIIGRDVKDALYLINMNNEAILDGREWTMNGS